MPKSSYAEIAVRDRQIASLYPKYTYKQLAQKFGVSISTVQLACMKHGVTLPSHEREKRRIEGLRKKHKDPDFLARRAAAQRASFGCSWDDEKNAKLVALYRQGKSLRECGNLMGVSYETARKQLKKLGENTDKAVRIRMYHDMQWTPELIEKLRYLYIERKTSALWCADILGFAPRAVLRKLKDMGLR